MTVDEVALFCGVSAKTVRRAIERGDLEAARLGDHGALEEFGRTRSTSGLRAVRRGAPLARQRWLRSSPWPQAAVGAASGSQLRCTWARTWGCDESADAKPKVPRGVEARWHAGRGIWTFRVRWTDPVSGERRSQDSTQPTTPSTTRPTCASPGAEGRWTSSVAVASSSASSSRMTGGPTTQAGGCPATPSPPTRKFGTATSAAGRAPRAASAHDADRADAARGARGRRTRAGDGRKSLAVLQSICAHAVRKGELTINPVSAVRKPPAKRATVIDPFSIEEVEALIAALRDRASHPSQWMLAELVAYSGARPQDALALSYARIGTKRIVYAEKNVDGHIVPGSKTGQDRARSVTLLAPLRRDLLAFRLAAGNPPDDARFRRPTAGRGDCTTTRTGSVPRRGPSAHAVLQASSPRPRRASADPTRRRTSSATPTPACASPSSASHSKRSPRRWATRSRSSRARTRTSSRSTAGEARSPPTR